MDARLAIGDRGLSAFVVAFLLTQAIEVPIFTAWIRRFGSPRSFGQRAGIAFTASLLTHPVVWFLLPSVWIWIYVRAVAAGAPPLDVEPRTWGYGVFAEGFAVAAEALFLKAFRVRWAFFGSLVSNAASAVFGLVWFGLQP